MNWMIEVNEREKVREWKAQVYHMGLSSFDEVVHAYEEIVPMRGKQKDKDIRPLGKRWKYWSRVIKIDENTYALTDGYQFSSDIWGDDTLRNTVPILWERKADGDYITIRNYISQNTASITRYSFLREYLPKGVSFHYHNGKHFVDVHNTVYALPKSISKINYSNSTVDIKRDNKIVLKIVEGKFVRVNELLPVATKRKNEIGKQYDKKIKAFYDWLHVILPVLGETITWEARNQYVELLSHGHSWRWQSDITPKDVRDILDNEDDPRRIAFGIALIWDSDGIKQNRYDPQESTRRRAISKIRKLGGMYADELK